MVDKKKNKSFFFFLSEDNCLIALQCCGGLCLTSIGISHCCCHPVAKSCLFAIHGLQHTRLPCPSLSPGVCPSLLLSKFQESVTIIYMVVQSLSCVMQSHVDHQALLSIGFSRQEYWSGLPFPSPGDLPDPRVEPRSPALQADSLPTELPGIPSLVVQQFLTTDSCSPCDTLFISSAAGDSSVGAIFPSLYPFLGHFVLKVSTFQGQREILRYIFCPEENL